jgi:hypothetical protein
VGSTVDDRAEWFQQRRTAPRGSSPDALRLKALRQMEAMIAPTGTT